MPVLVVGTRGVAGSAVLRVCWGSSDGWVDWVCRGSLGSNSCWSAEAAWAEATGFANASVGTAKLGQCQRSVGAPAATGSIGAPTAGAVNEAGVWNEAAAGTADAVRARLCISLIILHDIVK